MTTKVRTAKEVAREIQSRVNKSFAGTKILTVTDLTAIITADREAIRRECAEMLKRRGMECRGMDGCERDGERARHSLICAAIQDEADFCATIIEELNNKGETQ